jgi:hypothetical protein
VLALQAELKAKGLPVLKFKDVNIRADVVCFQGGALVEKMISANFKWFFVGIESFSDPQLKRMAKGITAKENITCMETMARLNCKMEIGFMPFGDECSTVDELYTNVLAVGNTAVFAMICLLLLPGGAAGDVALRQHAI